MVGATRSVQKASKTTAAGRKKSKGALSTRDNILKISTELFAKDGYDRVTMRDISSAVGVTMPTIYHHFRDKKNLYREVERENYGTMRSRLIQALESGDDAQSRLRSFASEMYDLLAEDPIFLSLAVRNMLDPDKRHHKFLVGVALQNVYDAFSDLLNEIRPGSGDGLGPIIILSSIFGFVVMAPPKRHIKGYMYAAKTNSAQERDAFVKYAIAAVLRV